MKLALALVLLAAPVTAQTTDLVSLTPAYLNLGACSVSASGRFVAYEGGLIRDMKTGITEDVTGGAPYGANVTRITPDGRFVVFEAWGDGFWPGVFGGQIFLRDRATGALELISQDANGYCPGPVGQFPSISDDGRFVAFDGDTRLVDPTAIGYWTPLVFDRWLGMFTAVAQQSDGTMLGDYSNGEVIISGDGSVAAFTAGQYVGDIGEVNWNVHIRDMSTGALSQCGYMGSDRASGISADGSRVVGGSGVVFDFASGVSTRVNVTPDGTPSHGWAWGAMISADGRFVSFMSDADDLVAGDTNGWTDVFVRDLFLGVTEMVSVDSQGAQSDFWSDYAAISADGRFVAFYSDATNLVPGDANGLPDVFLRDRTPLPPTARVTTSTRLPGGHKWP